MNPPPAWLNWASAALGIILTFLRILEFWSKRQRVEFRLISVHQYYDQWSEWEEQSERKKFMPPSSPVFIKAGECKRSFEVLEFAVRNHYSRDITVGRFMINNWVFADRYTRGMYDRKRDYRVFDLYSREATSLDCYRIVPPGGSYGLRVEIHEEAHGQEERSFHYPHSVDLSDAFRIEFRIDTLRVRRKIKIPGKMREKMPAYQFGTSIYRWSTLLGPPQASPFGSPLPQNLQPPSWRLPWSSRMQNWYRAKANWVLYGTPYRSPDQPSRLARAYKRLRRKLNLLSRKRGR